VLLARAAPHPRVATVFALRARHDPVDVARAVPLHVPVVCAGCARGDCIGDWARAGEAEVVGRTGAAKVARGWMTAAALTGRML
jgi:hypothetical protein